MQLIPGSITVVPSAAPIGLTKTEDVTSTRNSYLRKPLYQNTSEAMVYQYRHPTETMKVLVVPYNNQRLFIGGRGLDRQNVREKGNGKP